MKAAADKQNQAEEAALLKIERSSLGRRAKNHRHGLLRNGNQAMQRLFQTPLNGPRPGSNGLAQAASQRSKVNPTLPLQAKRADHAPNATHEREPDRVVDQMLTSSSNLRIQRKCACEGGCDCASEKDPHAQVQTKRSPASVSGRTAATRAASEGLHSTGQPLESTTRSFMEARFGHDFSRVRVHTDGKAAEAARSINALAYTVGNDVVFGVGHYETNTNAGKMLLAHELTHVVQQANGVQTKLGINQPGDQYEQEADRVAEMVVAGTGSLSRVSVGLQAPGKTVQRQKDNKKAGAKKVPSWTVDELKKMLTACDGGLGIWDKAKKANGDKDPKVTPGSEGSVVPATGEITLDKTLDKCAAVQQLIQELSNLSRKADFETLDNSCMEGDVERADYIKRTEKIEYETGVKNVLKAFDACKDTWKCTTTPKEWARKAKDFDDYFDKFLSKKHKEFYGDWWDKNCKEAYNKKHPKK